MVSDDFEINRLFQLVVLILFQKIPSLTFSPRLNCRGTQFVKENVRETRNIL
jgi:hypothetical protein